MYHGLYHRRAVGQRNDRSADVQPRTVASGSPHWQSYAGGMSPHQDARAATQSRTAGLELLVVLASLCALAWGIYESIVYGRELGHPLGVVGFLELWFREVIIGGLVLAALVAFLCVRLWRLLRHFVGADQSMRGGVGSDQGA